MAPQTVPISGEWFAGGFDSVPVQQAREETNSAPAPRPPVKMAIVMPFIAREMPRVALLLEWMAKLSGGKADRTIYLLPFKGLDISDLRALAAKAFSDVQMIPDAEGVTSDWQLDDKVRDAAGPNSLFRQAAWFFQLRPALGPWLWLEPDCVPLVPDWDAQIEAAYRGCGSPFMGALMRWVRAGGNGVPPEDYLNGAAVYPQNTVTLAPALVTRTMWQQFPEKEIAFDVAGGRAVMNRAHTSDLLQLAYRSDELKEPRSSAVLFHGDRSGKLLARFLSVPVLAERDAGCESRDLMSRDAEPQARESTKPAGRSNAEVTDDSRGGQKPLKRKRGDAPRPRLSINRRISNGAVKFDPETAPSIGDLIRNYVGELERLASSNDRRVRILRALRKAKLIPRGR